MVRSPDPFFHHHKEKWKKQSGHARLLYKGQLAELPTILDSFYTSIKSDYIEVEMEVDGKP